MGEMVPLLVQEKEQNMLIKMKKWLGFA
jgi:septum site-determining protein MinD